MMESVEYWRQIIPKDEMAGNEGVQSGFRVFLFDIDDTLFDRRRAQEIILDGIASGMGRVFAGLDRRVLLEAFSESDRISSRMLDENPSLADARAQRWRVFLRLVGRDEKLSVEVNARYMHLYPRTVVPVRGERRVVRGLSKKYRLGVVSNGFRDIQYRKLKSLGIFEYFACVVLSDEIGIRKPDKRIFFKALDQLGASPGECLYIGDSYEYDILGAAGAGIKGCWLNPGGNGIPAGSPRPYLMIRKLTDLLSVLRAQPPLNPCSSRR